MALSEENEVTGAWFKNGKAEFVTLDRGTRSWNALSLPKEHVPMWAFVLGFDGTTLVTMTKNGTLRRYAPQ